MSAISQSLLAQFFKNLIFVSAFQNDCGILKKALINWDIFYFNSESGSNTGRRFWTSSRVFNQTHFISNSIFHPIENSGFRFSNVQEFKHEGLIFLMHTRTLHNVNENFICSLAPPGGQNQKSESIASKFVISRFCCKNFPAST